MADGVEKNKTPLFRGRRLCFFEPLKTMYACAVAEYEVEKSKKVSGVEAFLKLHK